MNNDIWKFHDWLIDQKNDNKVNENDFNFIIDHIRNNYCPNFENIFVQENFLSAVEIQMQDDEYNNSDLWSYTMTDVLYSICYKTLGDLIFYHEKIEGIKGDLQTNNIPYLQNNINTYFGSIINEENIDILFTDLVGEYEDFLIIFYNFKEEHSFVYDNHFNCHGVFDNRIEVVNFIRTFKNKGLIYTPDHNNVLKYLNYLKSITSAFNIT